jgi:transcriptional regulator EpsA
MTTSLSIAPDQSEVLLRVIEAAPQVCRRHQFFVWTQGDFQRWLPHKISICGSYDRDQRDVVFDIFNSIPLPEAVVQGLRSMRSEIVQAALTSWRKGRSQAAVLSLQRDLLPHPMSLALTELGYDQIMVHGLTRPGRADELESFFMFTQPRADYGAASQQALDMLLPCVHMAYQRVCVTERQMDNGRGASYASSGQGLPRPTPITEREREILLWVRDGLSNQQISEKLGISALTVKNHVQKILRKLGAANRAQAVAKAMTMNALGAAHMQFGESHY